MTNFEKPYRDKLIEAVLDNFKQFKRKPKSLLILDSYPGVWKFGKDCAQKAEIENVMFYSANETQLKNAAEDGLSTSNIDPTNLEQITAGKRYDVILAKGTFESVAHKVPSLDELLITLYKSNTLHGMVVLLARLEPTCPVPSSAREKWASRVPTAAQLSAAIDDTGLGIVHDIRKLSFDANCSSKEYADDLAAGALPHLDECAGKLPEFVKTVGDPVKFTDDVHVVTLTKKIERVKRDDKGVVVEENGAPVS